MDGHLGVDVSVDLGGVHVGDVLEGLGEAVVLADEGVEHIAEVDVGVLVAGVDAAVLVVELDGAGDGLEKSIDFLRQFLLYSESNWESGAGCKFDSILISFLPWRG